MKIVKLLPAILSAVVALTLITAPTASANEHPSIGFTSSHFCGTVGNNAWKRQYESNGKPQNVYANVFGSTSQPRPEVCLSDVASHGSGFTISSSDVANGYGAYPNIGQGDEWGVRPVGTWKPVRAYDDGMPIASVATNSLSVSGVFNSTFDIWLNRTDNPTVGQNDGAEVMIWLDCHDNCIGYRHVTIDGIQWLWTSHVSRNRNTGTTWNYDAFVAVHHRDSASGLWLNPFIRYAESRGTVSASWYLTAIDYGFELFDGGSRLRISNYSLTGISASKSTPVHKKPVKHVAPVICWRLDSWKNRKAVCRPAHTPPVIIRRL